MYHDPTKKKADLKKEFEENLEARKLIFIKVPIIKSDYVQDTYTNSN